MRRTVYGILLLAVAALASGCASVAGGNSQKMQVTARTMDGAAVQGAECVLSNDKGTWRLTAPGDAHITRSNKAMDVRCEKPSVPAGSVSVESGVRAAMFGNILIGGVIGAVIDHTTGSAYEYPEIVRVVMGQRSTFTLPRGGSGPSPSGFAALNDPAAIPYVNQRGREAYQQWLTRPSPRAFAIAPTGNYAWTNSTTSSDRTLPSDPVERALLVCERSAKMPCKLYAVNGDVVWTPDGPPAVSAERVPGGMATAAAPGAAQRPAAVVPTPAAAPAPAPAPVARPSLIATGYAAIEDVDAIPYLSDRGRTAYRDYLTRPTPKAFAVSDQGAYWMAWSLVPADKTLPTDPTERALAGCERAGKGTCKLYAINGSVVWPKPASR